MLQQTLPKIPPSSRGPDIAAASQTGLSPLVQEIAYRDPLELFAPFANDRHAVLLESAVTDGHRGRYSYVAIEPFQILSSKNGNIVLGERELQGNPFHLLDEQLGRFNLSPVPDLPPFQGGAVGYFGYELAQHLERVPMARYDEMQFPDLVIGFHDVIIAVDHQTQRAWILSSGIHEIDAPKREQLAIDRLNNVIRRLKSAPIAPEPTASRARIDLQSNFTQPSYETAVERVINYILAGDIFQANLSQCLQAKLPKGLTGFDLYRRLRKINPAPFAALIRSGDVEIVSASPERFLKLQQGRVETCPIKGTRPRGSTPQADEVLAAELLASEKDRAENVMIVDLLRNDLSRVCRDGSVDVPRLCELETFATVFHLVSTVTGELQPGKTAVDLLAACFPGGSITGAPKIRAMEIIAELEPTRRGPYCGSIGYVGFDGSMDTSITIRTYCIKDGMVTFQAGGGIVADSRPTDEYDETVAKARALIAALAGPGGGP
jgi:para-aminobenzoate synthetase component I